MEEIWLHRGQAIMIHHLTTYFNVSPKLDLIGRDSAPYRGLGRDGALDFWLIWEGSQFIWKGCQVIWKGCRLIWQAIAIDGFGKEAD